MSESSDQPSEASEPEQPAAASEPVQPTSPDATNHPGAGSEPGPPPIPATEPAPAQPTPPPMPPPQPQEPTRYSDEVRRQALANAVHGEVIRGGRIESQGDFNAVIVHGKAINHVLHLLITLVTCGLWAVVWLFLVLAGGEKRVSLMADPWGNLIREKV
jgi:hypothetical protein